MAGLIVLTVLLLSTSDASAQARRIYAGAGVIADDDRTNSALTDSVATTWTVVAGVDLTPHFGVRFVVDTPREVHRFLDGIYTPLFPSSSLPVHQRSTFLRSTMTSGVLGDVHHQLKPWLRLTGTFGFLNVTHHTESRFVREQLQLDGTRVPLPDLHDRSDFNWTGLTVGGEVAVLAVGRIEIVPEIRTIVFLLSDSPAPYIIRKGIGVRWRF